jgi:hypothetical protein
MALLITFMTIAVFGSGVLELNWILSLRLLILGVLCSSMIYVKELYLRIIYLLNLNDGKMRNRYKNIMSLDLPNALIVLENSEEMTMQSLFHNRAFERLLNLYG